MKMLIIMLENNLYGSVREKRFLQRLSHQSTEDFPKISSTRCPPAKLTWVFMVWTWNFPMQAILAQLNHQHLNWGKQGSQFFGWCCGVFCDVSDASSLRSRGNFGQPASPGRTGQWPLFYASTICGPWLSLWSAEVPKLHSCLVFKDV